MLGQSGPNKFELDQDARLLGHWIKQGPFGKWRHCRTNRTSMASWFAFAGIRRFMTLFTKVDYFKIAFPTLLSESTIVTFRNFFLIDSAKFS